MRKVRNPLNDKENFGTSAKGKQATGHVEALQMELKAAQGQIAALRERNMRLQQEVSMRDSQLHEYQLLKQKEENWMEERQFMEEQQVASQKQLDNLARINQQLRQQLERSQQPPTHHRQTMSNFSSAGSGRSWLGGPNSQRSCRGASRQNHQSTPKSQLKLNWDLIGTHLNQKKKVFL